MAKPPVLLLPSEYVADATKAIQKAKKRVSFLCMLVTDDDKTDKLIDAMNEAALRGVDVEVAADVFTYGVLSGHFSPTKYFTKKSRITTRMAKRLDESNVTFHWLGRFANTPFNGRTHIKWCVVDDIVYSFGGVNLYQQGIMNNDYMFKVTDKALANTLADEFDRLVRADNGHFSYRSRSIPSPYGTIHIDGGIPLDSIIYRRACSLAQQAKSITYVSQYCPTSKLSRIMKKRQTRLYYNIGKQGLFIDKLQVKLASLLTGNTSRYKKSKYLHAKFMIFTMSDGEKIALTGSHNFVHGGVLLGTREIALETEDPAVISQLESFFHEHVA